MSQLKLTAQDKIDLNRVASTEVDHRLARTNPEEYQRQVAGVVDTILNRVASPQFPNSVRDVANQRRQFSKIAGPKNLDPYGDVRKVPDSVGPKVFDTVFEEHISGREAGAPSVVGGGLHYANPNFITKNNKGWVSKLDGPRFGQGQRTHVHGTTAGYTPVEASLAPPQTAVAAIDEAFSAPIPKAPIDRTAYAPEQQVISEIPSPSQAYETRDAGLPRADPRTQGLRAPDIFAKTKETPITASFGENTAPQAFMPKMQNLFDAEPDVNFSNETPAFNGRNLPQAPGEPFNTLAAVYSMPEGARPQSLPEAPEFEAIRPENAMNDIGEAPEFSSVASLFSAPEIPKTTVPGPNSAVKDETRLVTAGLPEAKFGEMEAPALTGTSTPKSEFPVPQQRIERKGMLDGLGIKLPGVGGVVQGIDHAIANGYGPAGIAKSILAGGSLTNPKQSIVDAVLGLLSGQPQTGAIAPQGLGWGAMTSMSNPSGSQTDLSNVNWDNHNAAAKKAIESGADGYVSSTGSVMPTHAPSGELRNTYGD